MLSELKVHLGAIVADHQRQTDELNAMLAEMNAFEKSWELNKRFNKYSPQYMMIKKPPMRSAHFLQPLKRQARFWQRRAVL